jgi:dihydroxyacetone kinase phosphotransfer subunit
VIGIVVVSHSPDLARAAVALASQLGGADLPALETAAGTADGETGTDAVAIAAAIDRAAGGDGVLVIMDLGSAILSAELALDFVETDERVLLSPAPFVEGLVAAAVLAATGATLPPSRSRQHPPPRRPPVRRPSRRWCEIPRACTRAPPPPSCAPRAGTPPRCA